MNITLDVNGDVATLTMTPPGETRLNERLTLDDEGTVWLTWDVSLDTPEVSGCGYDTESEILGYVGQARTWKACPYDLLGRLEDLEDEWDHRQSDRGWDERGDAEFCFYLGLEVGTWK